MCLMMCSSPWRRWLFSKTSSSSLSRLIRPIPEKYFRTFFFLFPHTHIHTHRKSFLIIDWTKFWTEDVLNFVNLFALYHFCRQICGRKYTRRYCNMVKSFRIENFEWSLRNGNSFSLHFVWFSLTFRWSPANCQREMTFSQCKTFPTLYRNFFSLPR